ncbi:hypothetical protein [Undibacterium oligocarboniphilum]|uniref:Uncharacterized protein n=1 Tax=Undibacterium oligocarboniphilum TaxID=666702 RepID=A0A850QJ24_9BURK|nr:hypothetical protein [Undibacterium oligocarboniphilum]MBC3871177.1 hypothetical protein [Undibacterium oligocarboniphilum]NVO79268.1 hypothetical protein [Undibacterium oligocarboniphilum]
MSLKRIFLAVAVFSLWLFAGVASAANYTLWVNGRGGGGVIGDYTSFTYWGPASTNAGINKKAVNWDGYNSIASQNGTIRDALDCFCTGNNWCYIATHSAGDLMMGYTLANYGGSARVKKNAVANSSGQCGDADGTTQVGWNIKWVRAASGAAGGSELSDVGSWAVSEPLVQDLKTTTARAMYNHNDTHNVWFYMYAGAKGAWYSGILPGQDDSAVAYHSTGGVAGSAGQALCNPADWFCNDLTLGTAVNEGGSVKWGYHSVAFRDDAEAFNHYANSNWEGIVSVVRAAMVSNAI